MLWGAVGAFALCSTRHISGIFLNGLSSTRADTSTRPLRGGVRVRPPHAGAARRAHRHVLPR